MEKKIYTHDGLFHRDEVAAVAVLMVCDEFEIIRTRDRAVLEEAKKSLNSIVVDVGMEYNPESYNYDHHQRDFNETRENDFVKYSSIGLVWKDWGREYISAYSTFLGDLTEEKMSHIWQHVDNVIRIWDANDNGQEITDVNMAKAPLPCISIMNDSGSEAFEYVVAHMQKVLLQIVKWASKKFDAIETIRNAAVIDGIMYLEQFVPWQAEILTNYPDVNFVIFPDQNSGWRLQCVPAGFGDQSFRVPAGIPAKYRGLEKEELPSGVIFVHANGFIAGAEKKEDLLKLLNE